MTIGDIVVIGGGGNGTHRLRPPSHGGVILQVSGTGTVGVRRRVSGGDSELAESAAEMGVSVTGD